MASEKPQPAGVRFKYGESPGLAVAVEAGKLPPVEKRLPQNPMLILPVEQIGQYGGTWKTAMFQDRDGQWLERTIGCDNLVGWDPEWTHVIPNLAEAFFVNSNATQFTFRLRKGVCWSDGAPFTSDDILFWYEKVFHPAERVMEGSLSWFFSERKPCVVEKKDSQTVIFQFPSPHGLFLSFLAGFWGDEPTRYPRHYLAKYADDSVPLAETNTLERAWQELLRSTSTNRGQFTATRWRDPQLPTLMAWQLTKPDPAGGYLEATRNPYYWKVDMAGNQLPYLDKVVIHQVNDMEAFLNMACNGELDLCERSLTVWNNMSRLEAGRERGNYRFLRTMRDRCNTATVSINLNHPDPAKRLLYQNLVFRKGLSVAIDRMRIIQDVFSGQGIPSQPAPRPESPYYNKTLATQYTEFDTNLAGKCLDEAGLSRRDAQGWRLLPDGRTLKMTLDSVMTEHREAMKRVRDDWRAVGIETEVLEEDNGTFYKRLNTMDYDVAVWWGEGGLDPVSDPRNYFPFNRNSFHARLWARWFADPADPAAVEPPDAEKRQMELYRTIRATPDRHKQVELMQQILKITAEQFPVIGISFEPTGYILVREDFRNVPAIMPNSGFTYLCPAPANPCQFYKSKPKKTP